MKGVYLIKSSDFKILIWIISVTFKKLFFNIKLRLI